MTGARKNGARERDTRGERERYNGVLFHKFCYNRGEKCSSFLWDFVVYKGFFCFLPEICSIGARYAVVSFRRVLFYQDFVI